MGKNIMVTVFEFINSIDYFAINEFCEKHDVVQIHPPIAVPLEVYSDGRGCATRIIVTIVYKVKSETSVLSPDALDSNVII